MNFNFYFFNIETIIDTNELNFQSISNFFSEIKCTFFILIIIISKYVNLMLIYS